MKNVQMRQEGDKLIIEVNLKERQGLSSSGKTTIIASTEGNVPAPNDESIKIGLNIFTKP